MIKVNARHIIFYIIGIVLLFFGYPGFWDEIKENNRKKEEAKKMQQEVDIASSKAFEVQELILDPLTDTWKNDQHYFQTINVGKINFKALQKAKKTMIETNDDENASDSF